MMKETWKKIDDASYDIKDYFVSNLGNIKDDNDKIIDHVILNTGYHYVDLSLKNNKTKRFSVHRLVAKAFIPNEHNLPQINHIDEDKSNNRYDNLEWCTPLYNSTYMHHAEKIGKSVDYAKKVKNTNYKEIARKNKKKMKSNHNSIHHKVIQVDIFDGHIINRYESIADAIRNNPDVHGSHIKDCCAGRLKQTDGYIWINDTDYAEDLIKVRLKQLQSDRFVIMIDKHGNKRIFKSIRDAMRQTGISRGLISHCIKDKVKDNSGNEWKMA